MQPGITEQGNYQHEHAYIVKFIQEGMIFFGSQEFLHEGHIEEETATLHNKIQIFFLEKTDNSTVKTINGLCKKHQAQEKCIARIIKKLGIALLEIISQ